MSCNSLCKDAQWLQRRDRPTPTLDEHELIFFVQNTLREHESKGILTSNCSATPGLLVTDRIILNHGLVTRMTLELIPPPLTSTPHTKERTFEISRELTYIAHLHGESSAVLGSNS
ncbi:hypothetical protein TNCV_3780231 [Trichonephila clavipes]|nr:hypothetical protein TNCV_3780231 [Trichonephila clavipes]